MYSIKLNRFSFLVVLLFCGFFEPSFMQGVGSGDEGNLRVCVVEGKGTYKRAGKFCPVLDEENSGVECVIGTDRLDCLRRMGKGTVDFGVFSPEDLIAAQWANVDVLVTNELRHRPRKFERSIVAVVNKNIVQGLSTASSILRNATLCHPGHGDDGLRSLSDALTEYLETQIIDRSCDPTLSMTENRIKAMSQFFWKGCKAGPWVQDKKRDAELKSKYPNLCSLCASGQCSSSDAYWGSLGALGCLARGGGVTWAERDDVAAYFGLVPGNPTKYASPDKFLYLCRDGSTQSLGVEQPCVWLHRPWPAVVAKRKASSTVRSLAHSLTNNSVIVDKHWHGALAALLDMNQVLTDPTTPERAPLDYLTEAKGFREAYSRSGCSPPRHITLCTSSIIDKNKCEWLSEAASVFGVEPPLQCVIRVEGGKRGCFEAVDEREADVVVAGGDWFVRAQRDHKTIPLLHEMTPIVEQTDTVIAYVRNESSFTNMDELRGKRAAFPTYDGLAWHAVAQYLAKLYRLDCSTVIYNFFGSVCAPVEQGDKMANIKNNCEEKGIQNGGLTALRLLVEGKTDVAFISLKTYKQYVGKNIPEEWAQNVVPITPLCREDNKEYCFISWANLGHVYVHQNATAMKKQEVTNIFTKFDQLFGKSYPFRTAMFSMYGVFNHKADVLFHNDTKTLGTDSILKMHPYDKIPFNFESSYVFDRCKNSHTSSAVTNLPGVVVVFCLALLSLR